VATASEYLVITECYIDDIELAKKSWILPGQHRTTFDVSPMNYTFEVHAMSAEKLSFLLQTVFTIGPRMDDFDSLLRCKGHEYFSYLDQKLQNEAANQAKIDVAEAKMKGAVGAKLRKGQTVQNAAKIDAETKIVMVKRDGESKQEEINVNTKAKIFKNQREAEIAEANAQLATKKANWDRDTKMAEVEASKVIALKEAELQREVEFKNALTQTEKLRAQNLSKATIENEIKAHEAEWELFKKQRGANLVLYEHEKQAEESLYSKTREAEALKNQAEASLFAMKQKAEGEQYAKFKEAEGDLYSKIKKAEGLRAFVDAQGFYVKTLMNSFGGNYTAMRD
ncbi:hypothetical protein GIB67_020964, partial [Kingdonia uniflora]